MTTEQPTENIVSVGYEIRCVELRKVRHRILEPRYCRDDASVEHEDGRLQLFIPQFEFDLRTHLRRQSDQRFDRSASLRGVLDQVIDKESKEPKDQCCNGCDDCYGTRQESREHGAKANHDEHLQPDADSL